MQPPPRKVKPNIALKNTHADQLSKLQAKHQQECDLLEDIRTYFARKSVLEKEYAQGLQKITSQLLKRDFPAQPDLNSEDGQEHNLGEGTTVTAVWRSILEESDKLAKARLQAAEVYFEKAAEPLKPVRAAKMQLFKKVMPQLSVVQSEVAQCVMELVKTQKLYLTEGGMAHEARTKVSEAEDKLKRKSTGIFQSLSGLQKSCAKLRSRTEVSETKETAARNEYLLALAAANAHHMRYYSTDLPDVMKTLDCDIYEKIQESLTIAGQTAADLAQAETTSFNKIAIEAAKICRAFSLQCYLFQNPVFTNLVQYHFEPSNGDLCNKISSEHGAGPDLEKEARKWSTKVAKETRAIRDYYRQITVLQNAKTGDKTSDTGSQESSTVDPEVKLEEIKVNLRKAETAKLKAEARLEALRLGGVNVDEWINQAQMESLAAEESGLARTPSQASLRTESSGGQSGTDEQEQTYTHYDEDDDFIDDTFTSAGGNRSGRAYPIYCKALYDFVASNYDEMTIKAEEDLELIADGDGEGWVKAKNSLGQEGYIPETYVDLGGLSTAPTPLGVEALNAINTSMNSPAQNSYTVPTTTPDLQSPDLQQDTTSSYSSGDLEVQQTTEVMDSDEHPVPMTVVTNSEISWARALYDYEGQTEEELSFLEGALIRVLRKDDRGVDDGFWEGECNGNIGVFPSLVVEEIPDPYLNNDPLSPPVMPSVPDFSIPPPVQITLPTPDAEPPPPPVMVNGEDCMIFQELYSNPVPCSTADQLQKKVRFTSRPSHHSQKDISLLQEGAQQTLVAKQHSRDNGTHLTAVETNQASHITAHVSPKYQTNSPAKHQKIKENFPQQKQGQVFKMEQTQGQVNEGDGHHHHVRPIHPVQPLQELKTEPSPIMRHKSLPSNLDKENDVSHTVRSEDDLCPEKVHPCSPQSPQSVRRMHQHHDISQSQPHLMTSLIRTPPPSRRLILQQRHLQQQQLQHYPSEPSAVNGGTSRNSVPQNLLLNITNNSVVSEQQRSYSYPNSPLSSPLKEDTGHLQNYIHQNSRPDSPQKQLSHHRQQLLEKYALPPPNNHPIQQHISSPDNYSTHMLGRLQDSKSPYGRGCSSPDSTHMLGRLQESKSPYGRGCSSPDSTHMLGRLQESKSPNGRGCCSLRNTLSCVNNVSHRQLFSSPQKTVQFTTDTHHPGNLTAPKSQNYPNTRPLQSEYYVLQQQYCQVSRAAHTNEKLVCYVEATDDTTDDDWEEGEESLV
ncbi:F-BAR and double SH3 domains protein 2-like isoform X3 [Biomphalaria glabrata]|uniref:F-BAR and double SH3 domains protein 2-like isoform X3 n=1 Tax=Biomphalaria glabrata TaxID=6526 RepID=A0A9U8ENA2_BIOGL|nr:F-BAR and double SH3 domains protein 2-like isoform X3 [Biomphalaria glabrata]